MATSTSYLQTLAKDEALTFVASLQKVKDHLSGELEWMNQQVQQKTVQLQGIKTLLSEATQLGLVEDLSSATEVETPDVDDSVTPSDQSAIAPDSDDNVSPDGTTDSSLADDTPPIATTPELTSTATTAEQSNGQNLTTSKPKREAKPSTIRKTNAAKARKPNNSSRSTSKVGKSNRSVDLRELLVKEFQGQTFTDSVAQILDNASKPLHLNELLAQMYEGLSDQDYERAKTSLANVLSVGKKEGKWQNLGQGMYAGNAVATA